MGVETILLGWKDHSVSSIPDPFAPLQLLRRHSLNLYIHLRPLLMARSYPRTASKTTFTLRYSSQLNMILESILVNMYSPQRPHARSVSFIRAADEQLRQWRTTVPDTLRLDRDNLPQFCPPTNVICLKRV